MLVPSTGRWIEVLLGGEVCGDDLHVDVGSQLYAHGWDDERGGVVHILQDQPTVRLRTELASTEPLAVRGAAQQ